MINKKAPVLSVIICTFNTKKITLECLNKLKSSIDFLGKPVETIVIENGTDGTGEIIKNKYKWVKLIEPIENTGFAKGNNLGIKNADNDSKYILLLNSDVFVEQSTLKKTIEFFDANKDCDVLGCGLKFKNGMFQPSAGYLPTPFNVFTWFWGWDLIPILNKLSKPVHPKDKEFFRKDRQVGWVMGAYLAMKKEVVEKTKGMDENFFMYMEEVEWCKRIQDAGFKTWYTPKFFVTHLDKASSSSNPEAMQKIYQREIMGVSYYLKKYFPLYFVFPMPTVKLAVFFRYLAFSLLGDELRKEAYIKSLKEL